MRLASSTTAPDEPQSNAGPVFWSNTGLSALTADLTSGLHHDAAQRDQRLPGAGDVSQRFGIRLRAMRSARNLTQQEMARRFGIDRSFISDVERGRKSISLVTLEVLALGLGVSISELLSDI